MKKMWLIRRRMALGAYIFGLLIFPIAVMLKPDLKDIAIPYYTLITFVLTAYYTFATYHDVKSDE